MDRQRQLRITVTPQPVIDVDKLAVALLRLVEEQQVADPPTDDTAPEPDATETEGSP